MNGLFYWSGEEEEGGGKRKSTTLGLCYIGSPVASLRCDRLDRKQAAKLKVLDHRELFQALREERRRGVNSVCCEQVATPTTSKGNQGHFCSHKPPASPGFQEESGA